MTTEQIARGGFVETEPAGVGFYAGPPSFDVSHGELVLTAHDFHRFTRCSLTGGWVGGDRVISVDHLGLMISDQVSHGRAERR